MLTACVPRLATTNDDTELKNTTPDGCGARKQRDPYNELN